ncbi:molecular chaperone [Marinomonas epiphytica]
MSAGQVNLLTLEENKCFLPSALYALDRDFITEAVAQSIQGDATRQEYVASRRAVLSRAQRFRREEDIQAQDKTLFYGRQAFSEYYQWPDEGYFVKSPKSFLGGSGLRTEHIAFFEDVVAAMMLNVKQRAQQHLATPLTHAVIGRPVNFQGVNAQTSNQQALQILTCAAHRVGFKEVEFLYEPIAAGLHFEQELQQDQIVLVVDIGGGTTDCAMVQMGPSFVNKLDRTEDFLGHTGERIGGNDLDIRIAGKHLMPLLGMESELKTGLPMPTQIYWNAITTNDVTALADFNSLATADQLEQLRLDAKEPKLVERFSRVRKEKLNYRIVRDAEQGKIALSDSQTHQLTLDYIESALSQTLIREEVSQSIQPQLSRMLVLMQEAIKQAGCGPDCIYITGGSAKSPIIRAAVQQAIGNIPVLDGDHFGSVASGLTVWADRLFK